MIHARRSKHVGAGRSRRHFTLVELLIAIAIIGLLFGMLGPSLSKALVKTRFARWKASNAQWNSDPSCVINFSFEIDDYKTEVASGVRLRALYNSAEACDAERYDSRDYDGILVNGPRWTTGRWEYKKALQFDGVDDFVIVPTAEALDFNPQRDEFTVCVWVYFDRFAFADCVFSKSQWGRSSQYTMYWYNGSMETDLGQSCVTYDRPKPKVGVWTCYTYVSRLDTGCMLYANGEPMQLAGNGSVSPEATRLGYFVLGAAGIWQNRVGYHFRGKIDECLVFNRALSGSEIRGLYQMGEP